MLSGGSVPLVGEANAATPDESTGPRISFSYTPPSPYSNCREYDSPVDVSIDYFPNAALQNIMPFCRDVFIQNGVDPEDAENLVVTEPIQGNPVTADNICYEDDWLTTISDGRYTVNGTDDTVEIDRGGHGRAQRAVVECLQDFGVEHWPAGFTNYFVDLNIADARWPTALLEADKYMEGIRSLFKNFPPSSDEETVSTFLNGIRWFLNALEETVSARIFIAGEDTRSSPRWEMLTHNI